MKLLLRAAMKKSMQVALLTSLLATAVVPTAGCPAPGPVSTLPVLRKDPVSLTLPKVGGGSFSLDSLQGKKVYIVFFSTWCRTCVVVFNRLLRLQSTLGKKKLAIVGVSVDRDPRLLKVYVETLNLPFPILYSTPRSLTAAGIGRVRGVPTLLLLDRKGRPRAIRSQLMTTQAMGKMTRRL